VFQPLLEVPVADRRRPLGLPPDRRQQRPADPMALEVEAKVTRDRAPPSSGSTVRVAFGRIGPSTPRATHLLGALRSVTSWVMVRSVPPTRRVVVNLEPTPAGRSSSTRTRTTSRCHSAKRAGSVA
jgi:hypothetical protein